MRNLAVVLALLVAIAIGVYVGHRFWPTEKMSTSVPATGSIDKEILYWVAPMDPNYRRADPGKSPMGMDLVPVYASNAQHDESGIVSIAPHIVNNLGVRTGAVVHGTLTQQIDTTGYLAVNEETVHHIHTRVEGWIEQMTVKSHGERVSAGQTLFELYSPVLVGSQEEYLTAIRTGNRALIDASGNRLKALGLSEARLASLRKTGRVVERVPVRAEHDGIVEMLNVRAGMYVQPSTTVMSLYSLQSIWLIAELFERDSSWLVGGSPVTMRIESMPDRVWNGMVDYIYPELNPVTRALRARVTLVNPDEVLRPNMFATVMVSQAPVPDVLHIPREALIRGQRQDRVVVALADGRYQSRLVETGMATATRVQIRSGLNPDDRVVVSGQFLIDSESNISMDLARMDNGGDSGGDER